MTLVSILIPVFNTEKYIGLAIQSILNQTYTDFELVVVDDCSSDKTYEICAKYASTDKRIKLYRNEKNLGMMQNWNHGLSLCHGEYWGKLDADDYWAPTMIEESLFILRANPETGLFTSKYLCIDKYGDPIKDTEYYFPGFAINNSFYTHDLVKLGPDKMFSYGLIQQGIGLMRKSFFDQFGKFTLLDAGDTEMWFRIGAHYKIFCSNKVLHFHRIWDENFTRKNVIKNNKLERNLFLTRKHIFNYYYTNKLLNKSLYKQHIKKNYLLLNRYLIYMARVDNKPCEFFLRICKSFTLSPLLFIIFYYQRLKEKNITQ